MKWLTPFAWTDKDGSLHLALDRVCEELGWPKTDENERIIAEELTKLAHQVAPGAEVVLDPKFTRKGECHEGSNRDRTQPLTPPKKGP